MTLALQRVRKGGLLQLRTDRDDNEVFHRPRRAVYY